MPIYGSKIYTAIGKMIVAYSALDFYLRLLIVHLDSRPDPKIEEDNYPKIKSKLKVLGHAKFANAESALELDSLLEETHTLQKERNKTVHSLWLVGDSVAKRSKLVSGLRKGLRTEDVSVEEATIKKLTRNIERTSERLMSLFFHEQRVLEAKAKVS